METNKTINKAKLIKFRKKTYGNRMHNNQKISYLRNTEIHNSNHTLGSLSLSLSY